MKENIILAMNELPWQVRLAERSIKKREKLGLLRKSLPLQPRRVALDLGCSQGALSYFARQRGGFWVSADEDMANLREAQALLGTNIVRLAGGCLPFKAGVFDLVLCLDYLEHIDNDAGALEEIERVLKKGGELILATPRTGKFFPLHKLRAGLGLKLEDFGHKREGYSLEDLGAKLSRAGLEPRASAVHSRFFSEFLELILNLVYMKILSPRPPEKRRDGHIRPSSRDEFRAQEKTFSAYSKIYPLVWLVSRLDTLLFFQKGYSLMMRARKP